MQFAHVHIVKRQSLGDRSKELFGSDTYLQRVGAAAGITIAILLLILLFWYVVKVVFLVFAGVLLGILFSSLASWVHRRTKLRYGLSLALVLLLLVLFFGGLGWYFAPRIAAQGSEIAHQLPKALTALEQKLVPASWQYRLFGGNFTVDDLLPKDGSLAPKALALLGGVVAAITSAALVLVIGIYFALEPDTYRRGIVRLVPIDKRKRAEMVVDAVHDSLQRWLVGTFIAMIIVGALTGIGLWLLGVPNAFLLGIIAGLLEFIPVIGPILSAVPGVLIALLVSPTLALYVALMYFGVQHIESYLIQPIIFKKVVYLPPALLLVTQVLLGVLFGFLGVMFATPTLIAFVILVKMLYVEDVLGDETHAAGSK